METALLKTTTIFPTKRALAKLIGVSPERLNSWFNNGIEMPVEYAFQIQRATKFHVKWYELVSKETKERMQHANTPLEKEMGYFIELSDVLISNIKTTSYTTNNKENIPISLERPVCIDENNNLIFGLETLLFYQKQKINKTPARRLSLAHLLEGCYCPSMLNQLFKLSERIAIGIELEGHIGNRQGQRTDLQKTQQISSFEQRLREKFPEVKEKRTLAIVAYLLGFGNNHRKIYEQAKSTFQLGCSELVTQLDQGKISVSKAAKLAKLSHEEQKKKLAL